MVKYELKKVFSKTSSKLALLLLLTVTCITCFFAGNISYVNENGDTETGPAAVDALRKAQKEWAGYLDEERIRQVILRTGEYRKHRKRHQITQEKMKLHLSRRNNSLFCCFPAIHSGYPALSWRRRLESCGSG